LLDVLVDGTRYSTACSRPTATCTGHGPRARRGASHRRRGPLRPERYPPHGRRARALCADATKCADTPPHARTGQCLLTSLSMPSPRAHSAAILPAVRAARANMDGHTRHAADGLPNVQPASMCAFHTQLICVPAEPSARRPTGEACLHRILSSIHGNACPRMLRTALHALSALSINTPTDSHPYSHHPQQHSQQHPQQRRQHNSVAGSRQEQIPPAPPPA
jgi:hypothetical protein